MKPSAPAAAGPLSVAPANDEGEVIRDAAELMILIVARDASVRSATVECSFLEALVASRARP
jgi:hypothetical protein